METKESIRTFIRENFAVTDDDALNDRVSLLAMGIVDTNGLFAIVAFLEKEFSIAIPKRDIVSAHLDSIERLAAYVAGVLAASAPARFNARGALSTRATLS